MKKRRTPEQVLMAADLCAERKCNSCSYKPLGDQCMQALHFDAIRVIRESERYLCKHNSKQVLIDKSSWLQKVLRDYQRQLIETGGNAFRIDVDISIVDMNIDRIIWELEPLIYPLKFSKVIKYDEKYVAVFEKEDTKNELKKAFLEQRGKEVSAAFMDAVAEIVNKGMYPERKGGGDGTSDV